MALSIPITIKHLLNQDSESFIEAYKLLDSTAGMPPELAVLFTTKLSEVQLSAYPLLTDVTNKTSLHYAVAGGENPDFCACFDPLIEKQDKFGLSALMLAAKFCLSEWLEYLIEDENSLQDCYGRTALVYSICSLQECEIDIKMQQIGFLMKYEWALLDNEGKTCVDYAYEFLTEEEARLIENEFLSNCEAFGVPAGVKVAQDKIISAYSEVEKLRQELLLERGNESQNDLKLMQSEISQLKREKSELLASSSYEQEKIEELQELSEKEKLEKSILAAKIKEKEELLQSLEENRKVLVQEEEVKIANKQKAEEEQSMRVEDLGRHSERLSDFSDSVEEERPVTINIEPRKEENKVVEQFQKELTPAQIRRQKMQDTIREELNQIGIENI